MAAIAKGGDFRFASMSRRKSRVFVYNRHPVSFLLSIFLLTVLFLRVVATRGENLGRTALRSPSTKAISSSSPIIFPFFPIYYHARFHFFQRFCRYSLDSILNHRIYRWKKKNLYEQEVISLSIYRSVNSIFLNLSRLIILFDRID